MAESLEIYPTKDSDKPSGQSRRNSNPNNQCFRSHGKTQSKLFYVTLSYKCMLNMLAINSANGVLKRGQIGINSCNFDFISRSL